MSEKETWMFIHYIYGDDVGYHTDDEDHIPFTDEEKSAFQTKILREAALIQSSDCLGTVPPEKVRYTCCNFCRLFLSYIEN